MSAALCDMCGKLIDCDQDPEGALSPSVFYHGKSHDFACEPCRDVLELGLLDQPPASDVNLNWDEFYRRACAGEFDDPEED